MSKRLITTDDATGNVLAEWSGGDEQTLGPVAGRTHRPVTGDQSYSGMRWNGTAFVALPLAEPVEDTQVENLWRIETKLDELIRKV